VTFRSSSLPRSQAGHQPHDTSKSLQKAIPVEHRAGCNRPYVPPGRRSGPDRTGEMIKQESRAVLGLGTNAMRGAILAQPGADAVRRNLLE